MAIKSIFDEARDSAVKIPSQFDIIRRGVGSFTSGVKRAGQEAFRTLTQPARVLGEAFAAPSVTRRASADVLRLQESQRKLLAKAKDKKLSTAQKQRLIKLSGQIAGTQREVAGTARQVAKTPLQTAGAVLGTGATVLGAPQLASKAGLTRLITTGAFGGGISKLVGGDFATGFGRGMGLTPTITGITGFTDPIIAGFAGRFAGGASQRIATALANIPEGALISSSTGMGVTPSDIALDFISGLAFGPPTAGLRTGTKMGIVEEGRVGEIPKKPPKPEKLPFQFNVDKLDLPKEAKDDFEKLLRRNLDEVQKQRRGKIGFTDVQANEELAKTVGMTADDFRKTKPGTTFNVEQKEVLASMIGGIAKKIKSLQETISAGNDSMVNKATLTGLIDEYTALTKVAVGATSEIARSLSFQRKFTAALDLPTQQRLKILKKFADRMTPELEKRLSQIDPTNPDQLHKFLRDVDKPNFGDYAREWWLNSILSGPATHARNLIGNTLFGLFEIPVRLTKAAIDIPLSKLQGRQREFYFNEVLPATFGTVRGIPQGVARGINILKNGYDLEPAGKLQPLRGESFARSGNKAVRAAAPLLSAPLRLLTASDAVFKSMNFSSEVNALAIRKANKEGLKGSAFKQRVAELLANPTTDMISKGSQFAKFATFNDEVSPAAKAFVNLRGKVPGMDYLVPFVSIADRLMARGIELTPAGILKAVKKHGPEQVDAIARATLGTAVMAAFASYAMDGRVIGPAPRSAKERDKFFREGKQAWSVKVGDRWVPFSQIEPLSTPLVFVAAAMNAFKNNGDMPVEQQILSMASAIGRQILDKSYLSSLSDFFEAIEKGVETPEAVAGLGIRQLSGFVPFSGLRRAVSTTIDPRLVKTDTAKRQLQAEIPGLRQKLPARLDVFGEEIVPKTGKFRALKPGGTPFAPTKAEVGPLQAEFNKISFTLGFPGKSRRGTTLNEREYDYLLKNSGQQIKRVLTAAMASTKYASLDSAGKTKAINKIVSASRDKFTNRVLAIRVVGNLRGKDRSVQERTLVALKKKDKGIFNEVISIIGQQIRGGSSSGISTTTRESAGFPFPDHDQSRPGQSLRADLQLSNDLGTAEEAEIVFHLEKPGGQVLNYPQTTESLGPKESVSYGIELRTPNNLPEGEYEVFATVNGQEVPGTRKKHRINKSFTGGLQISTKQ